MRGLKDRVISLIETELNQDDLPATRVWCSVMTEMPAQIKGSDPYRQTRAEFTRWAVRPTEFGRLIRGDHGPASQD